MPRPFPDALRNLQYRDALFTKIPRALRFNDRVSMRSSTELREPFLDHRLFELALRQPVERKIRGATGKWMLRRLAAKLAPKELVEAPKRAVQTPQREWLRGPLSTWAEGLITDATDVAGGDWLDRSAVFTAWEAFRGGSGDNSFFVWQWINLGLASKRWD
jgi:asparagine synthase (glutamine-hydrolysing)